MTMIRQAAAAASIALALAACGDADHPSLTPCGSGVCDAPGVCEEFIADADGRAYSAWACCLPGETPRYFDALETAGGMVGCWPEGY